MDVIHMYRERCFFREVILLDQQNRESKLYYLPVLDEILDISFLKKHYQNGVCVSEIPEHNNELLVGRNLFWIQSQHKRSIIVSLDMVESLIRRNVTGLGLEEVVLIEKGGRG